MILIIFDLIFRVKFNKENKLIIKDVYDKIKEYNGVLIKILSEVYISKYTCIVCNISCKLKCCNCKKCYFCNKNCRKK